jgi:hypothetical protein
MRVQVIRQKLPVRPRVPFTPINPSQPPGYLAGPEADGQCKTWGLAEAIAVALDFARNNAGTDEAKSARGFAITLRAPDGSPKSVQVQTTSYVYELEEQQEVSLTAGCLLARAYGAGIEGWRTAQHQDLNYDPRWPTPIDEAIAVSNANVDANGNQTYAGVQVVDLFDLFFNALIADIRHGSYVFSPPPGATQE